MDKDTLLLGQVHPSWVQGDEISSLVFSSQTFKPTPKDEGLLSVYNNEKFSAPEAYYHYTDGLKLDSVGIVAVDHQECSEENLEIIEDNEPFDGHCSIDYRGLTSNQVNKKAKKLKAKAQQRGWLYQKK